MEAAVSKSHDSIFYPNDFHRYAEDGDHLFWSTKGDAELLPIKFFPAKSSHRVIKRWKKIASSIVSILDDQHVAFDAIDCVCRRQTYADLGNDDHTVVITMRSLPEITRDLVKMLDKIYGLTGKLCWYLHKKQD